MRKIIDVFVRRSYLRTRCLLFGTALVVVVPALGCGQSERSPRPAAVPPQQVATAPELVHGHIPSDRGSVRIVGIPEVRWIRSSSVIQFYAYFRLEHALAGRYEPDGVALINGETDDNREEGPPLERMPSLRPCYVQVLDDARPQDVLVADPTGQQVTVTVYQGRRGVRSRQSIVGSVLKTTAPSVNRAVARRLGCGRMRLKRTMTDANA